MERRRPLRLKEYDYASPGAYFVTMCTHQRSMLFGDIVEGGMRLNDCGKIIGQEWEMSASIRREITLDAFVVTPNHIHAVVFLEQSAVGATGRSPSGPPRHSLGAFVGGFKSATTKRINDLRRTPGQPVWQRNYYEHVIRDETSLNRIRESITGNPARWNCDRENPAATTPEAQLVWRA